MIQTYLAKFTDLQARKPCILFFYTKKIFIKKNVCFLVHLQ